MVICLERGADLHMAQLMPLPLNVSCFSKIQIGFTFLVPAHLGSPRQRAVKRMYVCMPAHVKIASRIVYHIVLITPPSVEERSIAIDLMSVFVCVCVCLSASISPELRVQFSPTFVCVGRGSVFLWRRCDMLRTSGFMVDVILFAHDGQE